MKRRAFRDSGLNTLVTGVVFGVESFTWKYEEKTFQGRAQRSGDFRRRVIYIDVFREYFTKTVVIIKGEIFGGRVSLHGRI